MLNLVAKIGMAASASRQIAFSASAGRGEAEGRVNPRVGMEEVVEGIEVARISGGQPSDYRCLPRVGHGR
ncbi:MAG TPA: hypothetical protein VNA57_01015 [Acidimicrobiales bacterium]|nr:hypothetical protein [Acidimicrobiales bacterium]